MCSRVCVRVFYWSPPLIVFCLSDGNLLMWLLCLYFLIFLPKLIDALELFSFLDYVIAAKLAGIEQSAEKFLLAVRYKVQNILTFMA